MELTRINTSAGDYYYGQGQSGLQAVTNDYLLNQTSLGSIQTVYYPYPNPNYNYFYNWGWGITYVEKESKMDKAFKIIKSLMDKKIIKDDINIKEFMEICEIISKEI